MIHGAGQDSSAPGICCPHLPFASPDPMSWVPALPRGLGKRFDPRPGFPRGLGRRDAPVPQHWVTAGSGRWSRWEAGRGR